MRTSRAASMQVLALSLLLAFVAFLGSVGQGRAQPVVVPAGPDDLSVSFIDVGQGDCILVEAPGGKNLLVDAGDSESGAGPKIEAYLARRGIRRLDAVLISHAHRDHFGGLFHLLGRVGIDRVLYGTRVHTPLYESLEKAIRDRGIPYVHVTQGQDLLGLKRGPLQLAKAQVVHAGIDELPPDTLILMDADDPCPGPPEEGINAVDVNDFSVVVRLELGSHSILSTGDATARVERRMLDATPGALDVTLLKVAHHGSNASSGTTFLRTVTPGWATIGVGAGNSYGHPGATAVSRLNAAKAVIRRTDKHGTIVAWTDGVRFRIAGVSPQSLLLDLSGPAGSNSSPGAGPVLPQH